MELMDTVTRTSMDEEVEDVCLDASFFVDESYVIRSFCYGDHTIDIFCLQSSSTDYDLTGQIIWPGAELMNQFILANSQLFNGLSVIELGSGVGLTGLLCSRFCQKVVMTDHNDIVLKVLQRNIELASQNGFCCGSITCEKLEWGNKEQLGNILKNNSDGFDLILGADICYQQNSIKFLFETVEYLLLEKQKATNKFLLAYISRAKSVDDVVFKEARSHNLEIHEIEGTRSKVSNGVFEGVIFEAKLKC